MATIGNTFLNLIDMYKSAGGQEAQLGEVVEVLRQLNPLMEDAVTAGRIVVMSLPNAVPVEGGLPLLADGKIVGAIGVSGATAPEDGIVAKAGADELLKLLRS